MVNNIRVGLGSRKKEYVLQLLFLEEDMGGEGLDWVLGLTHALRYMEWLANGDLLYSLGTSTQYSVIIYMGK